MQKHRDTAEELQQQINELQRKQRIAQDKQDRLDTIEARTRERTLIEASPVKAPPPAAVPDRLRALSPPRKPVFLQTKSSVSHVTVPTSTDPVSKPIVRPTASWSSPQPSASAGPSRLSSGIMAGKAQASGGSNGKSAPKRDEATMRLVESFEFGPKEFKEDPEGGDDWMTVEPNSHIRLKSRYTSHHQVQANLTMRFYVTPSELYSIIVLSRDRQHFDVPLDGPWVSILVVGKTQLLRTKGNGRALSPESQKRADKKSEKRLKKQEERRKLAEEAEARGEEGGAPKRQKMLVDISEDEDSSDEEDSRGRHRSNNTSQKGGPRNFVKITLTSLPSRRKGSAGGDSILNLLLFESDGVKSELNDRGDKSYKGGSGGAYEKWWKLEVGDTIGLVDPKIMKPLGKASPSGLKNPLGMTVDSPSQIFRIGTSRDMATCKTIKKDGVQCEDFVDLRYSKNCEYHIENAVRGLQGGRAEFASSTAGFDMGIRSRHIHSGDPSTRSGLTSWNGSVGFYSSSRAGNDAGGQMFVVGGSVVSDRKLGAFSQEFVGEKIGREKDSALKRRREQRDADEQLGRLLDGDGASGPTGGKYLQAARKMQNASNEVVVPPVASTPAVRAFSSEAIKRIGFNPSSAGTSENSSFKATPFQPLKRADLPVRLGRIPGAHDLSSVKAPLQVTASVTRIAAEVPVEEDGDDFVDLD